ncbi:hypothetical protein ETH_00007770 [Eimeria tenella]|uniref:Uncharacterized protein n=1 Tax=Eimeria tenella TaxID=5802 RepID=U6KTA7_EIMTE|nr:hypothetical protein ETH_00007770 [Eimeria tenella]CDJ38735.1 hypothetical protein ETH_00007770 [Eimeria tenella]|eukprot:XP_013229491.1 hypothetical protein ETH_00007770 [Eimeria tenella]
MAAFTRSCSTRGLPKNTKEHSVNSKASPGCPYTSALRPPALQQPLQQLQQQQLTAEQQQLADQQQLANEQWQQLANEQQLVLFRKISGVQI